MFIWEQTATCATYSLNWLVFITELKSVYSAVRTGSLNKAVCASSLKDKWSLRNLEQNLSYIFRTIKPTRCTNFSILFWNENIHISDSSSVHLQEHFTVHTAMVYVIPVCGQLESCPHTGMTYNIAVWTVKYSWWWTEELSETCRDSFHNKIEKLVHLVGFIIRNLSRCTVTWTSNLELYIFKIPVSVMKNICAVVSIAQNTRKTLTVR